MRWNHGSITCFDKVVEVAQVKKTKWNKRNGWHARIRLGQVTIRTDELHPSQSAAEKTISAALHTLITRGE